MSMTTTSAQLPWTQRVNLRLWALLAVVALMLGYPVYQYLQAAISGGVSHSTDGHGPIASVDLKWASLFEMSQLNASSDEIPADRRALDGQRVALSGEMWDASGVGDTVTRFDLVYSIAKCCFNGPPKVQHFVKCSVPAGTKARYYNSLVTVKGTLHVGVDNDPETGKVNSVYRLDVESVTPD
jgi:hypothetical protein